MLPFFIFFFTKKEYFLTAHQELQFCKGEYKHLAMVTSLKVLILGRIIFFSVLWCCLTPSNCWSTWFARGSGWKQVKVWQNTQKMKVLIINFFNPKWLKWKWLCSIWGERKYRSGQMPQRFENASQLHIQHYPLNDSRYIYVSYMQKFT